MKNVPSLPQPRRDDNGGLINDENSANDAAAPLPTLFAAENIEVVAEKKKQEQEYPFIIIQKAYPRIATAIELMWGSAELESYIHKLILDERGGRAGFPKPIMDALLKLYNDHTKRFRFEKVSDIWSHHSIIARQLSDKTFK